MASIHSRRAIQAAAVLEQRPDGLRLGELADVLKAPLSSAQRAVSSLAVEGFVVPTGEQPDLRYVLNREHPATRALVEFALRKLTVPEAIDLTARANPAVEFAGRDGAGYVLVLSPAEEPAVVLRLHEAIEAINRNRADGMSVEFFERGDLRSRILDDPKVRDRGLRLAPVKGSVARAFRNPHEHGSFDAPTLGRLHPSLPRVSRQALQRLAQKHGLTRVAAFGSAVRADFRPDSDLDVLIEPRDGVRLSVRDLIELRQELESLFGRDVDVVTANATRGEAIELAQRGAVVLYG